MTITDGAWLDLRLVRRVRGKGRADCHQERRLRRPVGAYGDQRLYGFRGANGRELLVADGIHGIARFSTIVAAVGRLYISGGGRIYAFSVGGR